MRASRPPESQGSDSGGDYSWIQGVPGSVQWIRQVREVACPALRIDVWFAPFGLRDRSPERVKDLLRQWSHRPAQRSPAPTGPVRTRQEMAARLRRQQILYYSSAPRKVGRQ